MADEYKRLLESEKSAMTSTIAAVEELETEHADTIAGLNSEIEAEREKSMKYAADLEFERKLRLSQVYKTETEKRTSQSIEAENKLYV